MEKRLVGGTCTMKGRPALRLVADTFPLATRSITSSSHASGRLRSSSLVLRHREWHSLPKPVEACSNAPRCLTLHSSGFRERAT